MKVTADANILFSAVLKEGVTRKIWFDPTIDLTAPEFLITEFQKYKKELEKKFSGTKSDFNALAQKIISQTKFVPNQELISFMQAAATLTADPKDTLYFACALKENTIIWSNDKGMKKQHRVTVKTTSELAEEIGTL